MLNTKPLYPISVLATLLDVHQRTLRIYDDEKVLVPQRSPKGRRLYSNFDIEKGRFIQFLTRDLGINLAGVKIILNFLDKNDFEENKMFVIQLVESYGIDEKKRSETRNKMKNRGKRKQQ
jgi:MerR family transcriptional regulator/heat shock protein HspR